MRVIVVIGCRIYLTGLVLKRKPVRFTEVFGKRIFEALEDAIRAR